MTFADIGNDPMQIVAACREARCALARKLNELDPSDVAAHEIVRIDMALLDNLQSRAESGQPGLSERERDLLGLPV